MNPALLALLLKLAEAGIPVLIDFLDALVDKFREAGLRNDDLAVAQRIVEGVEKSHPDWTGEEKRRTAFEAIRQQLGGRDVPDSVVNAMLELAVVRAKQA